MSNIVTVWVYHEEAGQWCTYSLAEQCIVSQNGTRTPCTPASWSRWSAGRPTSSQSVSASTPLLGSAQPSSSIQPQHPATPANPYNISRPSQNGQYYNTDGGQQSSSGLLQPPTYQPLETTYRRRSLSFFARYRVFKILWHENVGEESVMSTGQITYDTQFGESIYSKIRWVVVSRATATHCLCLPIMTYNRQGIAKRGVIPEQHAIIYTRNEPRPSPDEQRKGVMRTSIKVAQDERDIALDPLSRICYSRVYTVEHNVKVKAFGWIDQNSRRQFDIDEETIYRSMLRQPQTNVPVAQGSNPRGQ